MKDGKIAIVEEEAELVRSIRLDCRRHQLEGPVADGIAGIGLRGAADSA